MTKVQQAIFQECLSVMRRVHEGSQFNPFYYSGLVMAAENALVGNEDQAIMFYATATNQSVEAAKRAFVAFVGVA